MPASKLIFMGAVSMAALVATPAHALVVCQSPSIGQGAYGAVAAERLSCASYVSDGGSLDTNARVADITTGSSASADLSTGIMTAYVVGTTLFQADMWDTFTFTGLPKKGTLITTTLRTPGSLTGGASGSLLLSAGLGGGDVSSLGSNSLALTESGTTFPASVSFSFMAYNGMSVTVLAEIFADGAAGIADLEDPPTWSFEVPEGVSYTTASGVFHNVGAVPEPGGLALALAGAAVIVGRRHVRSHQRT